MDIWGLAIVNSAAMDIGAEIGHFSELRLSFELKKDIENAEIKLLLIPSTE